MVEWALSKSLFNRSLSAINCPLAFAHDGVQEEAYMLLPLPEPAFLQFDLFGESLPEHLLFLLELWVVDLLDFWFPEFTSFHLSKSVRLVVRLFGRGNQVKHVGSDKEGSEFLEITVVLVLDCLSAGCLVGGL
jgi:hypothetical protein